jgi:hypothetical protein
MIGALQRVVAPGGDSGGEKRNGAVHLVSLTATKTADGLLDPKLVLAWLLTAAGAPGYLIGALVPVREAGALLPQLGLAGAIRRARQRRWFWAAGSAVQGLAALGIAAAAVMLEGAVAGWSVLGLLAVLAVARSACSASYKDVLARTVPKGARGSVPGAAGSAAAAAVLAFAVLVALGVIPREPWAIGLAVAAAGGLWILAALAFSRLREPEAETDGQGAYDLHRLSEPLGDPEFRNYLAARALLIATALAPPFIVLLSSQGEEGELGNLGVLLIGSSAAAILSSWLWGRLSDRSSRWTLAMSGVLGTLSLGAVAATGFVWGGIGTAWMAGVFIFAAQIAYQGVRAGRSTHLADMDTHGEKPVYTALSNSMIGVLLLAGGGFGLLADLAGPALVLAIFAGLCALSVIFALRLSEVQED